MAEHPLRKHIAPAMAAATGLVPSDAFAESAGPLFRRERRLRLFQPPIVADCQHNYATHRPCGYGQQPQRKAPSRVPHQPHRVPTRIPRMPFSPAPVAIFG